ncbi:pantetheine-phosphate adenylyltransferase [Oceanidesulfovibrio marinus]|uniref:Phosphopantetheine adenylyltransferase n=1 Tax=Oceanidesulfovibrio marinus TaxID=370038 RepID=A0A6P1ZIC6_9BACT|nr:pantetheine-phosphate adenylyltransferase [Oceanidesulfovibrio marinus]QJT07548.1 pantetheine-phosphate adenylyltransferase [Oceanidesulfovibrio marinus]TVM34538.1 pantetheine-phosphate adenylyltransferase [Oceanidesulfovibrio marinus]
MEYGPHLAIYPGTFDPLTFGHVGIVKRGLNVFDKIIVAVAVKTAKSPLFNLKERIALAKESFAGEDRITVESFDGLLVEYAIERGAKAILRGLRAVSDFEYEFQLALMNRHLNRQVQTVFLMTDYRWLYISSTIIKEAARAGGDVRGLVPDPVYFRLMERLGRQVDSTEGMI